MGDVPLAQADLSLSGQIEPGDHPEQRRLAATGRTQKADHIAAVQVQVHIGDGGHMAELFGDVDQRKIKHGAALPPVATVR